MPLIQTCRVHDCNTLTMSELCLEHERRAETRAFTRMAKLFNRLRRPMLALLLAAFAAYLGRVTGHIGR